MTDAFGSFRISRSSAMSSLGLIPSTGITIEIEMFFPHLLYRRLADLRPDVLRENPKRASTLAAASGDPAALSAIRARRCIHVKLSG